MPINLGSAYGKVEVDVSGAKRSAGDFDQSMRQIESGLNRVGTRTAQTMTGLGDRIGGALTQAKEQIKALPDTLMAGIAGGLSASLASSLAEIPARVGQAVVSAANKSAQFTLAMDRMAQATGLSMQQVSALSFAADRYKIQQDSLNSALAAFSRYLVATKGNAADIQKELGAAADQFARMPPGIERNALAMRMFGESGMRLLPILSQGSQGLEQFAQSAVRAGQMIDERAVAAAKRYEEAMSRFEAVQNRVNVSIGNAAIPTLTNLFENFTRVGDSGSRTGDMIDLVSRALGELTSKGSISSETLQKLQGTQLLLYASTVALQQPTGVLAGQFEAAGNAALSAGSKSAAGAAMMASAAQTMVVSVDMFNARMADLARGQAMAAYSQMRFNEANNRSFVLARQTQDVLASGYRSQAQAYDQKQKLLLQGQYDIEQKRALITTERDNNAVIDAANKKLDDQISALTAHGGASRGAAAGIDALADAQEELAKRTQNMQGLMGQSLEPMNKMQKLQAAYALATGQTTLAQEQMKIAVQGVMKGFDAGSISMADALGLVLALRNGQIDYTRALQAAGPAAQPYINDLNEFTSAATEGTAKTLQLSQGVDNLPGKTEVKIDATVTGLPQVDDLHDRVKNLPSEKIVTIKAVVIGLDQLAGTFYTYAPATGSQPVIPTGGNLDNWEEPPAGQGTSQQTVNVNVDGTAVARASVNNGARPTAQNQRRNYRQP